MQTLLFARAAYQEYAAAVPSSPSLLVNQRARYTCQAVRLIGAFLQPARKRTGSQVLVLWVCFRTLLLVGCFISNSKLGSRFLRSWWWHSAAYSLLLTPDKAVSYSLPTLVGLGHDFDIAQLSSCPTRPRSDNSSARLDQIANQYPQTTW